MTTKIEQIKESTPNARAFDSWWETPVEEQINYLEEFYNDYPEKCLDLFSSFCSKYIACGISSIRRLLEGVCGRSQMNTFMRLQAAQSLLGFQEPLEEFSDDDPYHGLKYDEVQKMMKRNEQRKNKAMVVYKRTVLSMVVKWKPCENVLPTPLKMRELLRLAHAVTALTESTSSAHSVGQRQRQRQR